MNEIRLVANKTIPKSCSSVLDHNFYLCFNRYLYFFLDYYLCFYMDQIIILYLDICLQQLSLRVDCRHEMERVLLTIGHLMYSQEGLEGEHTKRRQRAEEVFGDYIKHCFQF